MFIIFIANLNSDLPIETLTLVNNHDLTQDIRSINLDENDVKCLLCEEVFSMSKGYQEFSRHLLLCHKFVISDIQFIANLSR